MVMSTSKLYKSMALSFLAKANWVREAAVTKAKLYMPAEDVNFQMSISI